MFNNILKSLAHIGKSKKDSAELRVEKSLFVIVALITICAAMILGILYIYLDHYASASIPLTYVVVSVYNLLYLQETKEIGILKNIQMFLILILPFLLMWSLGGFTSGSFVFIWSFFTPIAALIYGKKEKAMIWFYGFIFLVVISVAIDPVVDKYHIKYMPQLTMNLFIFLNIGASLSGIYFLINFFINEKEKNTIYLLKKERDALKANTSELKKVNSKLTYLANHDTLTKVPNRYYFKHSLKQMMSSADRHQYSVALMFLDLDGFKKVNDDFGHAQGDAVLVEAANRLVSLSREEDVVARLGGDEFAMILGDITNISYVELVANRILSELSRDYDFIQGGGSISVSIGIALYSEKSKDIDTLIKHADEAMYDIKDSCKNSFKIYK
ncbi:GGDEF domain-containing protein [Sulfurimonas sp.]|jgi:diguanylate cyclase (GGDEF)-like protein|uniref:GGDEF domain-containing protein n=1 Tax=Sulfurimonas sp. TaxID=2022749 RepID=UPI0025E67175|nr:GGDEF domain-containing protein [Sulfurimonas sp.]MBT5935883.1 GGDEF domain-containing protein [Sulfurimonas sp.]